MTVINNDVKIIEELVLKHMPMIWRLVNKYNLNNHPELEDIVANCRKVLIEKAQSYDPSIGQFTTQVWLWLRKEMLESISKCQTIRFGGNVHNTNKTILANRKINCSKKQPILQYHVSIDAPVDNRKNQYTTNPATLLDSSVLGVTNFVYPDLNQPNIQDIKDILQPHEYQLLVLLNYTNKEKREMNRKIWNDQVIELLKQNGIRTYTRTTMLLNKTHQRYKYKIALKLYRILKLQGYHDVVKPTKNKKWCNF